MAVTIDWGTKVISVPRNDLTLIQSTPTEIREMDLNWFRMQLKDLEDSPEGMPHPDTHRHNTEVQLGGLTFARVIEIINGYTVTFEDGQYAVELTQANSNVGDVVNVNQVSVRSNNSAGLISTPLIEYASFENGVTVNSTSGSSGTIFPIGTRRDPVDNLSDALLIADYRGLKKIYVEGSLIIDSGLDYDQFLFEGSTKVHDSVDIKADAGVYNTVFRELLVTGVLDGQNELVNCTIIDLSYVNGIIKDSGLKGTITLGGGLLAEIINCYTETMNNAPTLDMGGSGQDAVLPDFSGTITIKNLTGPNFCGVGLDAGRIYLDNTVTSGTIHVSGTGRLMDTLGNHIPSGTWNGGVTVVNELSSPENISKEVWEKDEALALLGLSGENVQWSNIVHDGNHYMTGARITLYETNALAAPVKSWDITASYDADGEITSYEMVAV